MCHKKIVLKFKSIVMRATNNLFRRVHNCTHFKWWITQFERKCNILEIFHYFQYFERFRSMKKWQISEPKLPISSTGTSIDYFSHQVLVCSQEAQKCQNLIRKGPLARIEINQLTFQIFFLHVLVGFAWVYCLLATWRDPYWDWFLNSCSADSLW